MKKLSHALKKVVYLFLRAVLLVFIRLAFRPKLVYASEKARQEAFAQPRVIVVNHVRGWDGAVVYSCISRQPFRALVAKDMIEDHRFLRAFLTFMPVLPIDRRAASLSWLRGSRQALKQGNHVMIFPEGKCQFDRVTKPMKPGCVLLGATAGASLLPIWHNGSYHFFHGPRFRMIIGEPIPVTPPPEGTEQDALEQQSQALFATMNDLERQLTGAVRTLPAPSAQDR